jgi:dolichyl-phosphate-mannose-protein mannosyltransferase
VIQLLHIGTQSILLTHDVASPLMPTNQEFTTVPAVDEAQLHNDTLFTVDITDAHEGEPFKTLSGHFKLVHVPTKVLLWTHPSALPEWAYNQQEVNGNKNGQDRTTSWYVDAIVSDGTGNDFRNRTVQVEAKGVKKRSFLKKFFELQVLMLQHNAGLTASHPYASSPIEWPFCLSGVSFWTNNEENKQIYMIGNLIGWWICAVGLSIFVGIIAADMLARRRGLDPIEDG